MDRPQKAGRVEIVSNIRHFLLRQEGQSLIEVALFVPVFTILFIYAVDFGYFFIVAASLSSASRNAVEYAAQGTASPAQSAAPAAATVASLAIASIGLTGASASTMSVRVCSSAVGTNSSGNTARCSTPVAGSGAETTVVDVDPESPTFQLNRVDVSFTIILPIPLPAAVFPNTNFHRMVEMREVQ
jgi:Flp pilus assembly protein TadG